MMQAPAKAVVLSLALATLALSGCLGDDDPAPPEAVGAHGGEGTAHGAGGATGGNITDDPRPSVEGFLLDVSRAPLPGARVYVQNENLSTAVGDDGRYSFAGLIDNRVYILIAELDGYDKLPQQITAVDDKIVRLDFILEKQPEEEPYMETIDRIGLISCQAMIGAGNDHGGQGVEETVGCGGFVQGDANAVQTMEFQVKPGVAGIVMEVVWDDVQPLAEFLHVQSSTTGFGDLDTDLGAVIGPSVLKIEVSQDLVAKYYTGAGGLVKIHVDTHVEDDDEQAAGLAFAFQQPYTVYFSAFYVDPNPPGFSAVPE